MDSFKARFNYPIFFLLLIMALGASGMFLFFLYLSIPSLFTHFSKDDLWMSLLGTFLFGYLALQLDFIVVTLRYGFVVNNNKIITKDHLLWQKKDITKEIKGYSSSYYGWRNDIPCIIIYLENKKHINLPRYLFFNFSDIETALQECNIPYLGDELFYSKYIIARRYKFD